MGVPDIVKMAARSVGLSSAICRNAASRTRCRSPGARWTSSNRVRYEAFGYRNRVALRFPGGDRTAGCRIGNERRFAAGFFHREARDFLRLAFVEELETCLGKVVDRDSVDIADHHR